MAKVRLAPGVWTNVGSFTLSGAGAIMGATSDQTWLQLVGWLGMLFGLCLLAWGITIDGKHWWQKFPTWLQDNIFWGIRLKRDAPSEAEGTEQSLGVDHAETLRAEKTLRDDFERSLEAYRNAVDGASKGTTGLPYTSVEQLNCLAQTACGDLQMYVKECGIDCPWPFHFTEPHLLEIGEPSPRMGQMNLASTAAFVARHCEFLAEFEKRAEKLKEHSSRIHAQNATLAE